MCLVLQRRSTCLPIKSAFGSVEVTFLALTCTQTLIVAVRPIIFHLVELKVDHILARGPSAGLSAPSSGIRHLLKKMVDAAVVSMRILSSLRYQSQLQTYLAFDVTATFSSAVIISLAMFVSSKMAEEVSYVNEAFEILRELSDQGNVSARKRLYELENLRSDLNNALHYNDPQQTTQSGPGGQVPTSIGPSLCQPQGGASENFVDNFGFGNANADSTYSYDPQWWDSLSSQSLFDEDVTEGFEAFFNQISQYPEVIPLHGDIGP
jgi:hypothetical protein